MGRFFRSDALWGFFLTLFVSLSYLGWNSFLEKIELKFYDVRALLKQNPSPAKEVAIIAIDDDSLGKLGRWPWPRSRIGELLETFSLAKPKVIGLNILFSETEQNQGLKEIEHIQQEYAHYLDTALSGSSSSWRTQQVLKQLKKDTKFVSIIEGAKSRLDNDSQLAESIALSGNVVLPMFFELGGDLAAKAVELPEFINRYSLALVRSSQEGATTPYESYEATIPLQILSSSATGIGHVNTTPDVDGTLRREIAGVLYADRYYPSFAIQVVRNYLGLTAEEISIYPGEKLMMGKSEIPLDAANSLLITFNGPDHTFPHYSFYDVLNNKVAPEAFKDKIVLIGPTAVGVGTLFVTPVAHNFPSVEVVANIIENLLHKKFLTRPDWSEWVELGLILLSGFFIIFFLPKLRALPGAIVSSVIFSATLGTGTYLFMTENIWLKVSYPALLLLAGYTFSTTKRFLTTEKKKELVESSAIETNKMLGLSFQGQGMLDLAFEKFRACPLDDSLKELLYNLALDFERKRQYSKAVAVYEQIATKYPKYKDIQKKIETLKKAAEGAVMGGPIGKSKESTLLMEGATQAPTLGRYEIVKELGKGAMGIVYLGKDPKINRQVAIKTMRFDEDVDEKTVGEIKKRFFREAESAGNLTHPNIIKIYDAGEEQDVSYIAMELLEGEDLKKYTGKENLLPMAKALEYAATIAQALDYAHAQGVVHRDIKPANIMLLKDGSLRVTDFGIARLVSSSKTATGTVMGTPSYMSPEQIAGKKVDGRADLFSLGVVLFELLTGEKPWKGGDSIGTLLFQIANDPHPDPLSIRPEIPPGIAKIIEKALKKKPEERYQKGREIAEDIQAAASGEPSLKIEKPSLSGVQKSEQEKDIHIGSIYSFLDATKNPKGSSDTLPGSQAVPPPNTDTIPAMLPPPPPLIENDSDENGREKAKLEIEKTLPIIFPEDKKP